MARATLLEERLIPTIEPLAANSNREECAEDSAGAPTITLPPPPNPLPATPDTPPVSATVVQAITEILCANDDPDPAVDPTDNDDCDAGRRSFEQQVLSRADAADVQINLGADDGVTGAPIQVIVQGANTSARASCGPGNVPVLTSTSNVANIVLKIGDLVIPIQIPQANQEQVIDLGVLRLTLNELIVEGNNGQQGAFPDNAEEGRVTRRAVHLEVLGGAEPGRGSIADIVVSESIADFHGDVCPEGRIVVKKETAPDEDPNSTVFNFASPGLTPATFTLQDDGTRTFEEVQPGQFTITEGAPTNNYILTAINCAENRTDNSTTALPQRQANVNVGPGETVTCTFINAKPPPGICPPGSVPNQQGECVITNVQCPSGSTNNGMGQCIINTTTCPPGSSNVNNTCVANQPDCPAGTTRNPQGQCVITNIQCPPGTTFNPTTVGCTEAPRGGVLVPLNQRLLDFFRTSPCIGQGFGPLLGIFGTNGPDRITGTNASDRIFALGGNDRVSGGRGDDCVEGGTGRDVLDGSNGNDFLLGGTGNDQVNGGPGRDRFSGGSGRDVMSGGTGNDRMTGGPGRDRLQGGFGNDRLIGGSGNDGIHTGNGRDRVNAGSGNDIINAATVGPPAFVDCGPGSKDRVRINRNEVRRHRNCEFVDVPRRIKSNNREISPR